MKYKLSLLIGAALCAVGSVQADVWDPSPDYIITDASIVTMGKIPHAQALAVRDGKIIGVGSDAEVLALKGRKTKVINAAGKTIIPGLQDSHIHPVSIGRDYQMTADLLNIKTGQEMAQALAALKIKIHAQPGQWLQGVQWDGSHFKTLFTRWDIDPVTQDNPAYLGAYRRLGINTAAFRQMGIKDEDPSTWPTWWLKNPPEFTAEDTIYRAPRKLTINGETKEYNIPTGVFIGSKALLLIKVRPPKATVEDDVESIRLGSIEMQKVGLTSIIDAGNGFGYNNRIYAIAHERGVLGIKIPANYEGIFFNETPQRIHEILEGLKVSNEGDAWVRLRGAKIYADGGPSARGSWMTKPYLPLHPGDKPDYGVPVEPDYAKREAQFRMINSYGFDLHTHSTGDAAMLQDVRLYKKLEDEILAKNPKADLRWSIEHANLPLETPEVIETMAKYHIVASIQPVMVSELGHAWSLNIGKDRVARTDPVASYMKAGVLVVSGSDYNVTPFDPWLGMYAMVTRKDINTGEVYGPEERISLTDALKTYTINGAFATYEESSKGSLDVGKVADFVVVNIADLSQAEKNPELLKTMSSRVLATVIDGVPRYQKPGAEVFK